MVFIRTTSLLFVSCITLAACSPAEEETSVTAGDDTNIENQLQGSNQSRDAEAILKEIRSLAGIARASHPAQCKIVGIGPKPCGGFERHMIYSTEHAQENEMLQAVQEYNALRKQHHEQSGMVSDCQYQPAPQVTLSSGMCVPVETATE